MSNYGIALAGEESEYMIAWVDPRSGGGIIQDNNHIKLFYSGDSGQNWVDRSPSTEYRAMGTPGLRRVTGTTSWILSFAVLDDEFYTRTGEVFSIASYNDGVTWGTNEFEITDPYYRTDRGVNVGFGGAKVFHGFSWVPIGTSLTPGLMRGFKTTATLGGLNWFYGQDVAHSTPSLGSNSSALLFAITRGADNRMYSSSIDPTVSSNPIFPLAAPISTTATTKVTPALAADDNNGNIYVYYFSP